MEAMQILVLHLQAVHCSFPVVIVLCVIFTFDFLWYLTLKSVIAVGCDAASRTVKGAAAGTQKQKEQKGLFQSAQRILAASAWRAQSSSLLPRSAITGSAGELICDAMCHAHLCALCSSMLSRSLSINKVIISMHLSNCIIPNAPDLPAH